MSLLSETIMYLGDVPAHVPRHNGEPVTVAAVRYWIRTGIGTPNGRVRLEACRLGGRWVTSREALGRFARALTAQVAVPA
jgi:hypothetical protein